MNAIHAKIAKRVRKRHQAVENEDLPQRHGVTEKENIHFRGLGFSLCLGVSVAIDIDFSATS
jgi:hypothetical protein